MEITLPLVLSIVGGIGSLVSVWVALNSKITRLEKDIEHTKGAADKLSEKIDRLETSLSQILAALNRLEGRLEK